MASVGTFSPSRVKQRWGNALGAYRQATTYDKYPGALGLTDTTLGATVDRILRQGTMGGDGLEPQSLPGAFSVDGKTFAKALQPSQHDLGLLGNLLGFAATPVQQGGANVWLHRLDFKQSAVDLSLPISIEQDTTGDLIRRFPYSRVKRVELAIEAGAVVAATFTIHSLGMTYFGTPVLTAGTPTVLPELWGILNDANEALGTGTARRVNLQVDSVAPGPPIVITYKLAFGAVPSFGTLTQDVTAALTAEKFPRRVETVDSNSTAPGDELGDSDIPVWLWWEDGTGAAALDQLHWDYGIAEWTPVAAAEPELTALGLRLKMNGEPVAAPNSLTIAVENDYVLVPPGIQGAMSSAFIREGDSFVEIAFDGRWFSDVHQRRLPRGAKFDLEVDLRSSAIVDPGNHTQRFEGRILVPNARPDSGVELKTFGGGSADSAETLGLRGHPDASIGGANIRFDFYTGYAAL